MWGVVTTSSTAIPACGVRGGKEQTVAVCVMYIEYNVVRVGGV